MISRRFYICTLCVFLFSCAGGDLKQDNDSGMVDTKSMRVDVDSDVELDFKNALALMQQEKYRQAIDILKTVIDREQRLPAPYVNIAIAYNRVGETKDAELNLINALKLDIYHPVANNELGLLYRKAGKFKAARTAYENAINEHPDYLPARRNLGILCDLYLHDFECALEQFENYAESKPDDKDAAIWVADVKRRLGQ
jgi:tetratricopeptide (TPR) repeat protein